MLALRSSALIDACFATPMFAPYRRIATTLTAENWLLSDTYNTLAVSQDLRSGGGQPICFTSNLPENLEKYETRIFLTGQVHTRIDDVHDILNAWTWLIYPRSKAAINAGHYHQLNHRRCLGELRRSRREDALTLWDENGVVVLCSDPSLVRLIRGHRWRELFWERRLDWHSRIEVFLFGHGLLQKAMHPYIGLTGHGLIFEVEATLMKLPLPERISHADALLADYLQHDLTPEEFDPLPILGVPGFFDANQQPTFYEDTRYFRPQPHKRLTQAGNRLGR